MWRLLGDLLRRVKPKRRRTDDRTSSSGRHSSLCGATLAAIADGLQLAPESAREHSERALSGSRAGASGAGNSASSISADPGVAPVSGDPIRGFLWALVFAAPLWVWLSVWLLT